MERDEEIVQYYVVNKEVPMSGAKISAQSVHVATKIARAISLHPENFETSYLDYFKEWERGSQTVVFLEATLKEMEKVIQTTHCEQQVDEGRTEVPPGTLTVIGLYPMPRFALKKQVGRLRLLKM